MGEARPRDLAISELLDIRMNSPSRRSIIIASTGTLVITKVVLPTLLTWLVNVSLRRLPGYRGRVRRISLHFAVPSIVVRHLSLSKSNGTTPQQSLTIRSVVVGSQWRKLLTGALVGFIRIDSPRLFFRLDTRQDKSGGGDTKLEPEREHTVSQHEVSWQERVKQLPAFRLSSVVLTQGELHLQGISGQADVDIRTDRFDLRLENLTNSIKLSPTLMARATCNARVMANGTLALRAAGYPLAAAPTFDVDFQSNNINLVEVRKIIETIAEIDVQRGSADLYVEAAAADGQIQGYAKPIFDHLELKALQNSGFWGKMKTWAAKAAVKLGRNKRKDRVSTRIDFGGSLDDPQLNIIDAIIRFIRNGFMTAERASFDHRIWFTRAGRNADEVQVHFQMQRQSKVAIVLGLVRETFSKWSSDEAPRMAAALSYYTAFSMAPLLLLAISIAGIALGRDAAQGKIVEQIGGLVGTQSASAIQSMIKAADRPSQGVFASVIGIITLIAGATGVLSELKSALNKIWRTQENSEIKEIVKKNVVFLGMLLGMGFLLTVSLVVSAGIAGLGKFLNGLLPAPEFLLHMVDFFLSVGTFTLLFAAMYRFLPNTKVEWRDVWIGAAVTSLLFSVGKLGLGLYIGKSSVSSSYGAAGAVLILLLWVYYSGLIFYFGAEFTKVYADRHGSRSINKTASPQGQHRMSLARRAPVAGPGTFHHPTLSA
jgi:membrane protein